MTGGLAAPLVAAGAATIIGSAGAAALGSVAGIAVMTSLFGAAGAGLTGKVTKECWASGGCSARGAWLSQTGPDSHPSWLSGGQRRTQLYFMLGPSPVGTGCRLPAFTSIIGEGGDTGKWGCLYHRPAALQSHTQIPVPLPKWDPSLPPWRIVVTLTHFFERNVLLP